MMFLCISVVGTQNPNLISPNQTMRQHACHGAMTDKHLCPAAAGGQATRSPYCRCNQHRCCGYGSGAGGSATQSRRAGDCAGAGAGGGTPAPVHNGYSALVAYHSNKSSTVAIPSAADIAAVSVVVVLVGRSVGRTVGRSIGRPLGPSADRSVGRSVCRSVGRSVGRSVSRLLVAPSVCAL